MKISHPTSVAIVLLLASAVSSYAQTPAGQTPPPPPPLDTDLRGNLPGINLPAGGPAQQVNGAVHGEATGTTPLNGRISGSVMTDVPQQSFLPGDRIPLNTLVQPGSIPAAPQGRIERGQATAQERSIGNAGKAVETTAASKQAFDAASIMYTKGDYHGCIATLEPMIHAGEAPLEVRHLHIACLVATNRMSLACYQTLQAARLYPTRFLTDRTAAVVCTQNSEFRIHRQEVDTLSADATSRPLLLLGALYQSWGNRLASLQSSVAAIQDDGTEPWVTALKQSINSAKSNASQNDVLAPIAKPTSPGVVLPHP